MSLLSSVVDVWAVGAHLDSFVLVVSNLKIKLTRAYSIGSHCILGV